MKKTPLTANGARMLREELTRLKNKERPRIIQAIAAAREHGDLKENAEYHAAREQQSFAEGRIKQLEWVLSSAQIIDVTQVNAGGKVVFGATVDLFDLDTEKEVSYRIVGEEEADIAKGMISVKSPIARALIGREQGDEISVSAPGGERCYEIQDIRYI